MLWITEDAKLFCDHGGGHITSFAPRQSWVTVGGRRVLVKPDPEGRPMDGCIIDPVDLKPCARSLQVTAGYSTWIQIDAAAVCLSTIVGLTLSVPSASYRVHDSAQLLVGADG